MVAPLSPINASRCAVMFSTVMFGGMAFNWASIMPRDASHSDNCTSDHRSFQAYHTPMHNLYIEKTVFISFHIEWDMIVVTVFLSILNQIEFHLVQNQKDFINYLTL